LLRQVNCYGPVLLGYRQPGHLRLTPNQAEGRQPVTASVSRWSGVRTRSRASVTSLTPRSAPLNGRQPVLKTGVWFTSQGFESSALLRRKPRSVLPWRVGTYRCSSVDIERWSSEPSVAGSNPAIGTAETALLHHAQVQPGVSEWNRRHRQVTRFAKPST
jgi:hypothetical protein